MIFFDKPLNNYLQGPKLKHWSLQNGTNCVKASMPESPLTCLDFWCRAGSSFEDEGEEGFAHFLEHMVFKGSQNLHEGEFDRKIEEIGGSSNAATGFDDVHFHVLVPPTVIEPALEHLLNLVLTPTLCPEPFFIEREVVLEEIAQYVDQPDEQVLQELLAACWKGHAYGRPILGYKKSLKACSAEQIKGFHNRMYQGINCTLSIAGNIPLNLENIINNTLLSSLGSNYNVPYLNRSNQKNRKLVFYTGRHEIKVSRLESARFLMAWPLPPAKDLEKIMGADIATSIFAEGRRSRLVHRLREELQIVESIDMDITVLEQGGLILLEACCLEENLVQVEKEIHNMLTMSIETSPTNQELCRAQQLVKNSLCFSLEASSHVAALAGTQTLWNRKYPLLEPLKYIKYWTAKKLQNEIFHEVQPNKSFTLIARPKAN